MKADFYLDDLKRDVKELQNKMDNKGIVYFILALCAVGLLMAILVVKIRDKNILKNAFYGDYEDYFLDEDEYYEEFGPMEK